MAATNKAPSPQFTLYTNHGCGWCGRVHIVLKELGIQYEEVLIDLNGPRPDWYLKINPRGLVPSLHVKDNDIDEYLVESGPIVDFLIALYPSHLTPQTDNAVKDGVLHWRQRFFVDTFFTKVIPLLFKMTGIPDREGQLKIVDEGLAQVAKEIEPLLANAAPYFDGSKTITFVEAMCMPFVMLIEDMSDDVIWPAELLERLRALPNFSAWMKAGLENQSVLDRVQDVRKRRLEAVLTRLPEVRKKFADMK